MLSGFHKAKIGMQFCHGVYISWPGIGTENLGENAGVFRAIRSNIVGNVFETVVYPEQENILPAYSSQYSWTMSGHDKLSIRESGT